MKRRDLLKSALCAVPAAAMLLSGCKKGNPETSEEELTIIPKQTDVYKFSSPLTFNHDFIDKMAGFNKKYKKSQVEVLYNNIPWPASSKFNEWFQTKRGENSNIKTFADFMDYARHAINNGFKICYLINSPKPFNDKDIKPIVGDLYKLLDNLYNAGIKNIKVASPQVAELVTKHNKDFELTTSVLFEYRSIAQYKHLIEFFPNIKRMMVTKDENQNFRFLKNLKEAFPNTEIEIMLDEPCIKNCPSRFACMSDSETTKIGNRLGCIYNNEHPYINFYENGIIDPWNLEYYSAIGINHFKTVQAQNRAVDKSSWALEYHMEFAEYGFASNLVKNGITERFTKFIRTSRNIDPLALLPYFPDMEYFVKNGHKCRDICGTECNYCKEQAAKLKDYLASL